MFASLSTHLMAEFIWLCVYGSHGDGEVTNWEGVSRLIAEMLSLGSHLWRLTSQSSLQSMYDPFKLLLLDGRLHLMCIYWVHRSVTTPGVNSLEASHTYSLWQWAGACSVKFLQCSSHQCTDLSIHAPGHSKERTFSFKLRQEEWLGDHCPSVPTMHQRNMNRCVSSTDTQLQTQPPVSNSPSTLTPLPRQMLEMMNKKKDEAERKQLHSKKPAAPMLRGARLAVVIPAARPAPHTVTHTDGSSPSSLQASLQGSQPGQGHASLGRAPSQDSTKRPAYANTAHLSGGTDHNLSTAQPVPILQASLPPPPAKGSASGAAGQRAALPGRGRGSPSPGRRNYSPAGGNGAYRGGGGGGGGGRGGYQARGAGSRSRSRGRGRSGSRSDRSRSPGRGRAPYGRQRSYSPRNRSYSPRGGRNRGNSGGFNNGPASAGPYGSDRAVGNRGAPARRGQSYSHSRSPRYVKVISGGKRL